MRAKGWLPQCRVKSTFSIPYKTLYRAGFRGLLFDIDNTLVPHNYPATRKARAFFAYLHSLGFTTCLISNNKEPRVKSFAKEVKTAYVYKAGKPKAYGYEKGCEVMGLDREQVIFIGDQLFTDIWGANRAGLHNILVDPVYPKEEFHIILKRLAEKPVLLFFTCTGGGLPVERLTVTKEKKEKTNGNISKA